MSFRILKRHLHYLGVKKHQKMTPKKTPKNYSVITQMMSILLGYKHPQLLKDLQISMLSCVFLLYTRCLGVY